MYMCMHEQERGRGSLPFKHLEISFLHTNVLFFMQFYLVHFTGIMGRRKRERFGASEVKDQAKRVLLLDSEILMKEEKTKMPAQTNRVTNSMFGDL